MALHEKFNFNSLNELREKIAALNVDIELRDDLSALHNRVRIGSLISPNAIAMLPMEGCDSEADGSPSEYVERRYLRAAGGGSGLIWWEACAVTEEGKANNRQMMLTADNVGSFAALLENVQRNARATFGSEHRPINILQLTHSGRYSRSSDNRRAPVIVQHDPLLDSGTNVTADMPVVTDGYLDDLIDKYVRSAVLAQNAGYDGVDIKACNRYLLNELLAAYTRDGKYGGNFENRTRFHREALRAIREATGPDFIVACRFNMFDAHPYPYGFGENNGDFQRCDLAEPLAFVHLLCDEGIDLLGCSAGNPYYIYPQIGRPYDLPIVGIQKPGEHPLESVARLFALTRAAQQAAGSVPVVGVGYSWLRQFSPYAGAANIATGGCSLMGLGRSSFAYPNAPRDILEKGAMDATKCCCACSKCTQMMRDLGRTGCVIRDAAAYAELYKMQRKAAEQLTQ